MDYVKLVRDIVEPLVAKPEALLIREIPSEKGKGHIQILVVAEANDTARLIGRGGGVATSIREVVNVAGKLNDKRIYLKFESYEEKETE